MSYKKRKFLVVIPYIKGVSEELRKLFNRYEVPMYFKPTNILRQLLVSPKDKMKKERVIGPVYQISCEKCPATCIGETERSVKQRFLEHRRFSSASSEVSRQVQYIYGWHQHFGGRTQMIWAWGQGIYWIEYIYFFQYKSTQAIIIHTCVNNYWVITHIKERITEKA